jgi:tRNA pseudouridine13 synthase
MNIDPLSPPFLTAQIPGIGGRIKVHPEDFEVEEIPAYELSGTGDHLFLWIEKRDLSAELFLRLIGKRLHLPSAEIGTAGLKDRHAVTRQWISVPASAEGYLSQLDGDGIRLLQTNRHGNKFRILLREVDVSKRDSVDAILRQIRETGLPNYYGGQRFGINGDTAKWGMALLRNEPVPPGYDGRKPNLRNPFLRKLSLSAGQSYLFNIYLGQRLLDGLLTKVLEGDVMMKWPFGGMFTVENLEEEQSRFNRREIVSGGPMFGKKTFPAKGIAAEREAQILEKANLKREQFMSFGKLLSGTRRHNLIYVDDLAYEWESDGLRLQFSLPSGSYATILLREVMKNETEMDDNEPPEEEE